MDLELASCSGLTEADIRLLNDVAAGMSITADLSRSDILLLCACGAGQYRVVAQAMPHSMASVYPSKITGKVISSRDLPILADAWRRKRMMRAQVALLESGGVVEREVYPILGENDQPIALFSVEISLIQLERHRTRPRSFRQAIDLVKQLCMQGGLTAAEGLSPFGEWDGVLLVDGQRRIVYLSGIASNLYRRLGYLEDLRGKRLSYLNTGDDDMVLAALASRQPLEAEANEGNHVWIRKVMPLWTVPTLASRIWGSLAGHEPSGEGGSALIMVHDATDERRKKQQLKVKTTMIQEVHHRVKNNLQTVAAMLRMQARRAENPEALQAINEAISRILSVAVIHEFLSRDERQSINIRDVCQRIINQNRQVSAHPGQHISFSLDGPNIYLPSQQATACALVVNELIQNALEHGFEVSSQGQVRLTLVDGGDTVKLDIADDGERLPDSFDLAGSPSLGLQIVRALVQDDLHGQVVLRNSDQGVVASVEFPKVHAGEDATTDGNDYVVRPPQPNT